jgi:hypothetical protein
MNFKKVLWWILITPLTYILLDTLWILMWSIIIMFEDGTFLTKFSMGYILANLFIVWLLYISIRKVWNKIKVPS